jgi:SAM-dependent methyltransferase
MVTTICFLDDVQASFNEVNRILKPRGYFIIGFVDKESSLGKKYSLKKEKSDFYRIATFYSTQEVIDLLEKSGFISYKTVQTIFGDLGDISTVQDFEDGHGKGSFVVIKASKRAFK